MEKTFENELRERLDFISDEDMRSALDAYEKNPNATRRAFQAALGKLFPTRYFIAAASKIAGEKPRQQRHDLDPVLCRDCADTGFVMLNSGDAAPCHCERGVEKMKRFGMVNYGADDYVPAVGDPEIPLISLIDYARSEAGRADPNLEAMRRLYRSQHGLREIGP